MKASDIPDKDILELLAQHQGEWAFLYDDGKLGWPSSESKIQMVAGLPKKVILAKFKSLYRRELVGGCTCGCRGDFEITDKGLAFIGKPRIKPYNGY